MSETKDCKFCNRRGLPLLPLRFAYLPDGGGQLPPGMSAAKSLAGALGTGQYVLRTITEGFVYSYDTRAHVGWRCFAATPDGRFREVTIADEDRPKEAPTFRCATQGHGVAASVISVEDALSGSETWVGYFRTWLTRDARKTLRDSLALRQKTMVKLDPRSLVTGGSLPVTDGFRIDANGVSLGQHVLEYGNTGVAARRFAYTWSAACDRQAELASLAHRMHQMSPGNALALALPDAIGIVGDISKWRNFKAGELAKFEVDQKNLREKVVADIVLGLKQQLTDAGRATEWGRYAKHVDMSRVDRVRKKYDDTVKRFETVLEKIGKDWQLWVCSRSFWDAWAVFDGAERSVGLDMERLFSRAVEGSGATKPEQAAWDSMLSASLDSNVQALWLAFAAGDKSVLDFLKDKGDKANDVFKNARDGKDNLSKWLADRRKAALVRTATHDTGLLGNVIASQAARLFAQRPQQAQVLGLRLRIVAAARMDMEISPYRLSVQVRELVAMSHETVWGPPTARLTQAMQETRRLRLIQNLDGMLLGAKANVSQVVHIDMWLPRVVAAELGGQSLVGQTTAKLPPVKAPLALPAPALNPFKAFLAWSKKTEARLVGLGAALQLWNLSNTLATMRTAELAGDAAAVKEALFGVASGISGLGGVTLEVVAKTVEARVVPAVAASTSTKLLTVVGWTTLSGGLLAMGAAWTEATQSYLKARNLSRSGDEDAATAYQRASYLLAASGAAGAAVAIVNAGAAFTAAGITASSGGIAGAIVGMTGSGAVLLGIPVWGWIALGVLSLVAGVWFMFQGSKEEDMPLEVWLSRCCLRNEAAYASTDRARYATAALEMEGFQQAVFGLQVTLEWEDKIGKDRVTVQVLMPGFGQSSEYAFALSLGNRQGTWNTTVDRKSSGMSADPDLQPQRTQHYMSAVKPGQKSTPMEQVLELEEPVRLSISGGTATLSGSVKVSEDHYDHARLKFEYWPDIVHRPQLKMTPAANGLNFKLVSD